MTRAVAFVGSSFVAGVAAVFVLPPAWLGPLAAVAAICAFAVAIVLRFSAGAEDPASPAAEVLLSVLNLPEQPLAKVKQGWALVAFLSLAAFLVALAVFVMVRASA